MMDFSQVLPHARLHGFRALVLAVVVAACDSGSEATGTPTLPGTRTVAQVVVTLANPTVATGATLRATAQVLDGAGQAFFDRTITWSSTNTAVATVDPTGLVRGIAVGTAQINATTDGKTGSTAVTVIDGDIGIAFTNAGNFLADTATIGASVASLNELATVVASANGRTTSLALTGSRSCPTCRSGKLDLTGTARGPVVVTITATDTRGKSATATQTYVHDNPPRVTVISPVDLTVGRPGFRVAATCTDDGGACSSISAQVNGAQVAAAQGQLDQNLLPTGTGPMTVTVHAIDGAGQSTDVSRTVYVEPSSLLLDGVTSAAGQLIDVIGTRMLYVTDTSLGNSGTYWFQDGSSAPQMVFQGAWNDEPRLTPNGVIYRDNKGIHEWRNGQTTDLAGADASAIVVNEGFALWSRGGGTSAVLERRDLAAGVTTQVTTDYAGGGYAIAPNGDAAWVAKSNDVVWQHNGANVLASSDGATRLESQLVTDGSSVVYLKQANGSSTVAIAASTGGAETVLAPTLVTNGLVNGVPVSQTPDHLAVGGWIGFVQQATQQNLTHVWTRAPNGTLRQADALNGIAVLDGLDGSGTVVLHQQRGTRRFVSLPPYNDVVDISGTEGRVIQHNGSLLVLIGRSAFAIAGGK